MINYKVPTIEEIYNEYHRQTFYAMNKVYPRPIKNFDSILKDKIKKEYLLKFQNVIARNRDSVDWKLYIYACASLLKNRFDLKILGSLAGNKLYRNYINYKMTEEQKSQDIYEEIIRSLKFLNLILSENEIDINQYFMEDIHTVPLSLKHIYAGTISIYFYAAINPTKIYSWFYNYNNDSFQELFHMDKQEFMDNIIMNKREIIIKFPKIREICNKLDNKFMNE
jgi:hypothetical protein